MKSYIVRLDLGRLRCHATLHVEAESEEAARAQVEARIDSDDPMEDIDPEPSDGALEEVRVQSVREIRAAK